MSLSSRLERLNIDPFLLGLLGMIGLAVLLPCQGQAALVLSDAARLVVGLVFFLYGARLSPKAVWQGMANWRLQGLILASTFGLFPLLGLAVAAVLPAGIPADLRAGILFLSILPSTVQASVGFTAIARGNVPAAICAASASSMAGVVVTPLLAGLLLQAQGGISTAQIQALLIQVLLPFIAGQAARRWIGGFIGRHKRAVGMVDRGSILLIVYTAVSSGVASGVWLRLGMANIATIVLVNVLLLALVLALTSRISRVLGMPREDEAAVMFCGSVKSLATGVPMLNVLFAAPAAGLMVVPLILFHQMQLMVCAVLARRSGREEAESVSMPILAGSATR